MRLSYCDLQGKIKHNLLNDSCTIWYRDGDLNYKTVHVRFDDAEILSLDRLCDHINSSLKSEGLVNLLTLSPSGKDKDEIIISPGEKTERYAFSPNISNMLELSGDYEEGEKLCKADLFASYREAVLVCNEIEPNLFSRQREFKALALLRFVIDKRGNVESIDKHDDIVEKPKGYISGHCRLSQLTFQLRSTLSSSTLSFHSLKINGVIKSSVCIN